jgi:hypothetical protein
MNTLLLNETNLCTTSHVTNKMKHKETRIDSHAVSKFHKIDVKIYPQCFFLDLYLSLSLRIVFISMRNSYK